MDIALIGNCQSTSMARALASQAGLKVAHQIDINAKGSAEYDKQIQIILNKANAGRLTIISHHLGGSFGPIASEKLRHLPNYRTYTNIFFDGLHPDIAMLGAFQMRLSSPIGGYNSRIAAGAWLQGLTAEDCLARFNHETYSKLGYYERYAESEKQLLLRDERVDIRFAQEFLNMLRHTPSLFTLNHPTMDVIVAQAKGICHALGLTPSLFPAGYHCSPLAAFAGWPIYPEFARAHGLTYQTPFLFKRAIASGVLQYFGLEEFVHGSYRMFIAAGYDAVKSCTQIPQILAEQEAL